MHKWWTAEAKATFLYLQNTLYCSLMAPGGIDGVILPFIKSFLSNLPSLELLFQPLFPPPLLEERLWLRWERAMLVGWFVVMRTVRSQLKVIEWIFCERIWRCAKLKSQTRKLAIDGVFASHLWQTCKGRVHLSKQDNDKQQRELLQAINQTSEMTVASATSKCRSNWRRSSQQKTTEFARNLHLKCTVSARRQEFVQSGKSRRLGSPWW